MAASALTTFLVMGDWGDFTLIPNLNATAATMTSITQKVDVTAVLTTGDNFYKYGVDNTTDSHWKALFKDMFKPMKKVPFWATMGNHDWASLDAHAEIDYAVENADKKRWIMDDYHYEQSVTTGNTKIGVVHVDTDLIFYGYGLDKKTNKNYPNMAGNFIKANWTAEHNAIPAHFAKIEDMLKKHADADYIFALGHHMAGLTCDIEGTNQDNMLQLRALFEKYRVTSYLHGHSHHLASMKSETGMLVALSGSGGEIEDVCTSVNSTSTGYWTDRTNGFIQLSVASDKATFDWIDSFSGKTLHTETVAARVNGVVAPGTTTTTASASVGIVTVTSAGASSSVAYTSPVATSTPCTTTTVGYKATPAAQATGQVYSGASEAFVSVAFALVAAFFAL